MTFNTDYAGYPNYFPNSFSGPSNAPAALESKFEVSGDVARYNTADDDNFSQVGIYWTKVLDDGAKDRLVQNIAGHLKNAQSFIQVIKYMLCNYDVTKLIMKFQLFLGSCSKEFYSSSRRVRAATTFCS
jgi:catalase